MVDYVALSSGELAVKDAFLFRFSLQTYLVNIDHETITRTYTLDNSEDTLSVSTDVLTTSTATESRQITG